MVRRSDDSHHFVGFPRNRHVFVSYCSRDIEHVRRFVKRWSKQERVFGYLGVDIVSGDPKRMTSEDAGYVMRKIRQRYMRQTNVTIVLLGSTSHESKYVDWEIRGTLAPGVRGQPNGLLGIVLPHLRRTPRLPTRLHLNVNSGYARCEHAPLTQAKLSVWIDEAYQASKRRKHLIDNRLALKRMDGPDVRS